MIRITAVALLIGMSCLALKANAQVLPQVPMAPDGSPYIDGGGGLISNLAELRWLSETPSAWDESWLQTQDIDASETKNWNLGDHDLLPDTPDEPMGFSPIGDNSIAYNGSFNGGGFKIHGLYINRPQSDNIGFFGKLTAGSLEYINLERLYVAGDYYVGGLAGNVMQSSIVDCHTSGEVKSVGRLDSDVYPDEKPGSYLGGLIGYASHPTIEHCSSTALVTMTLDNPSVTQPTGGLIGTLSGGEVIASRSEGDVHGYSSTGGFIGSTFGTPLITNSFARGNVICDSNCGGLIGDADGGRIEDSVATGDVASTSAYVGGLVGGLYNASIVRSSASGQVLTTSWGVGGLVGRCNSDPDKPLSSVSDSYASGKVSGNTSGALIGVTWDGCRVSNSYATGFNSELFGRAEGIEPIIENSFFDCSGSETGCSQPYAKTTQELHNLQTFIDAGWNMGSYNQAGTWLLNHKAYPILSHGKAVLFTTLPEDIQLQGSEDLLYELTLQVEDIPANQHVAFEVIDAPAWLSLQPQGITASLSGTADDSGVGDNIVVIAAVSQGVRNDFPLQLVNISNINDLPVASSAQLEIVEDTLLSIDLSTLVKDDDFIHGDEQHSFSVITPLPDGHGNIELAGNNASYMPAANFFGATKFKYQVTDIAGATASGWVNVNVAPVNDAPVASAGQIIVNEDATASLNLMTLVQDVDDNELLFSVSGGLYGQLSLNGTMVSYTPNKNYFGADSFSYTVDDKHSGIRLIAGAQVSVAVLPVNDAPTAQSASYHIEEDRTLQVNLASLVNDIDGDLLSYSISTPPAADTASIALAGAMAVLTPTADFNGQVSFIYAVTDNAGGQAQAAINVEVIPVNDSPSANSGSLTVLEDHSGTINLAALVQDKDNDPLSFSISPASHGSVSLSGSVVSYQPYENYSGTDTFKFSVTDGFQTISNQVHMTIEAVNDAPTISGIPKPSVDLGSHYQFAPKVNDIEGDRLSFSINNKPAWASFNNRTGELVGTPSAEDDLGLHERIRIRVSDGIDVTFLADFTIEVTGEPEANFAIADSFTLPADQDERYVLNVLDNDRVAEGETLTLAAAQTSNGQVSIDGRNLIVALNQPLTRVTLSYFVDNSLNQQDSANVVLTLEREEDEGLPVINLPEPIWFDATGALSEIELPIPDAFDAEGESLTPIRSDDKIYFPPGRHTVVWQATDSKGNKVAVEQQVNIRPQVTLPRDASVHLLGYESYSVKFMLNGEAPQYPVMVDYILTDELSGMTTEESLLIEAGTEGVLDLMLTDNVGEHSVVAYRVALADSTNQGENNTFALSIQSEPQPPLVSSVLTQNGEKRSIIAIPKQEGSGQGVQVNLLVQNAKDGEQFNFEWHSDDIALTIEDDLTSSIAKFVPQIGMDEGVRKVSVDVTRLGEHDVTKHHSRHDLYLDIRSELPALSAVADTDGDGIPDKLEGMTDSDQDGIPDYQDAIMVPNLMPAIVNNQSSHLIEVEAGLSLKKGMTVPDNHNGGLLLDPELDNIVIDTETSVVGGIFDFIVQGLKIPGDTIAIVLPQMNPIPANASYRKYQVTQNGEAKWVEFDLSAGAIYSARGKSGICPAPHAESWSSGLTRGDWCVKLVIIDGGANDADGIANGTVVDPGGVAVLLSGNTLPILKDDSFTLYDDEIEVNLDVLANDLDAEDPLSIISATTSHGVITHDGQALQLTLPTSLPEEITIEYSVIELRENGVTQVANARVNFIERPISNDSGSLTWIWLYCLVSLLGYRRWHGRLNKQ
ncbi:GLUG domain protein [Shewanella halifaxensis HAW-EB4]|uniref:GLUG domain protein n=1 Tax=Shewanella halifaxensis (strain HAW-EB4) TaxID=458817 RepID=B0TN18_SHEHH|nr:Ig-like domain-containing protein [Shewanella halifaxensis]ABZ74730.1 GLUG domain protein [Shewanella halifaxensis HAW-EB4]